MVMANAAFSVPMITLIIIRIGFGVYYTIIITRNPQNPILIIRLLLSVKKGVPPSGN